LKLGGQQGLVVVLKIVMPGRASRIEVIHDFNTSFNLSHNKIFY
jgi:hypothetical protein